MISVAFLMGVMALVPLIGGADPAAAATSTPVMGKARVTGTQLAAFYRSKAKTSSATVSIDILAGYYISEGAAEGVAGDLAFAQSIVETGWFGFSSRVPGSFNNFSGLGAVDGGTGAAAFPDARTGVRAQIQHLRAYADPTVTVAKLANPVVDPRFNLVSPKGKAPTWEQFGNGIWATDPGYAAKVLNVYQQILDFAGQPPVEVPADRFAPFDSSTALCRQAHLDVLARAATDAECAPLAKELDATLTTPAGLYATLLAGEAQDHGAPVVRLYLAALGRLPDRGGLRYWAVRHTGGVSVRELARSFLSSSEFQRRFGDGDDAAYLDLLYRNVLGRGADPSGLDYWGRRLASGATDRVSLLVQFSESSEHRRTSAPTVEASIASLGMTLAAPSADLRTWWTQQRAAGSSLDTLTGQLLASEAYLRRFT